MTVSVNFATIDSMGENISLLPEGVDHRDFEPDSWHMFAPKDNFVFQGIRSGDNPEFLATDPVRHTVYRVSFHGNDFVRLSLIGDQATT